LQSLNRLIPHAVPECRFPAWSCDNGRPPIACRKPHRIERVSEANSHVPPERGQPVRRERIPLGILYMVGATVMFAGSSAISKWQVVTYPVGEVLFIRSTVSLICCALFILPLRGLGVFRTRRLSHHVLRSASQATAQTFIVIAFSLMPLAGAMAINFSAPLFATLVSALVLKEAVGWARGAALLVGFLGVLIVTNPGADTFQVGAVFALANAVMYGSVTAGVRGMTATESTETLTMYQMVLVTAYFALFIPFGFIVPTWSDGTMLVLNGVFNAFAQYWWTRALHLAPASAVTPFYYLSLVWAMIVGFVIWGDVPTAGLLIGSGIVVGSGLFLLWRETGGR
jgi:drug/metabolite transporter (DMT)-like permease